MVGAEAAVAGTAIVGSHVEALRRLPGLHVVADTFVVGYVGSDAHPLPPVFGATALAGVLKLANNEKSCSLSSFSFRFSRLRNPRNPTNPWFRYYRFTAAIMASG